MSARRRELPIRLLRRLLLVALAVLLVGVAAVYLFGRPERGARSQRPAELEDDEAQGNLILSGEGFDYELTQEGRKIFHIRADKILSDRQNRYALRQVALTLTRSDGGEYTIASDEGVYDIDSQEASLSGNVLFTGPRAVELTADGLELRRRGRLVISSSPVEFRFLERFTGSAERMRADARRNTFVLAGDVKVDTLPGDATPLSLRSRRFSYERDELLVRAEGSAVLTRGDDTLTARRLTMTLTEDERSMRFLRAYWDVSGRMIQRSDEGLSRYLNLAGDRLSVVVEPATREPVEAELEGAERAPAALDLIDESGLGRRVRADYMQGDFTAGLLRRVQAFDGVEVVERIAFAPDMVLRSLCADTADASLGPDGAITTVRLDANVDLWNEGVWAHGDRARGDLQQGRVELEGEPAWLLHSQGEMRAPTIVYRQAEERMEAGESVRAVIVGGAGFSLGGEPAEGGPIQVEARHADWTRADGKVVFRDKVRAWQGENFLITEELEAASESQRLVARGGVRTVWRQPVEEGAEPKEGLRTDEPIEVTAREMEFDRATGLLTYSQSVRVQQAGKTLTCDKIGLRRGEERGFREMECTGAVRMVDAEQGNTVTGERALYDPGAKRVRIWGSPVTLRDGKGTTISGQLLIYDLEAGAAQMQSVVDEEAPAAGTG